MYLCAPATPSRKFLTTASSGRTVAKSRGWTLSSGCRNARALHSRRSTSSDREMINRLCHMVRAGRCIDDLDAHRATYIFFFLINTNSLYTWDTNRKCPWLNKATLSQKCNRFYDRAEVRSTVLKFCDAYRI